MNTVPQTAPKVARMRRNKVTGQLDLFAPIPDPVPASLPLKRKRKMTESEKYIFPEGSKEPSHVKCPQCNEMKPIQAFTTETTNTSKYNISPFCVPCRRAYFRKRYREEDGKTARNIHLKNTYGITLEQYTEILESQGGTCAICGGIETGKYRTNTVKSFAVDHCHETGKVRGLLCTACNVGIGALKDSPTIMQSAITYLSRQT